MDGWILPKPARLPDPVRSAVHHARVQRWLRLVDFVLACGIAFATFGYAITAAPREPPPPNPPVTWPTTAVFVAKGAFDLILPIFPLYAPAIRAPNASTSASVQFASTPLVSGNVTFSWKVTSSPIADVRFVYQSGIEAPLNTFRVDPAGGCESPCGEQTFTMGWMYSDTGMLWVEEPHVDYTVWKVSYHDPFNPVTWIQVRYVFSNSTSQGVAMPYAGVTVPTADDLVPLGVRSQWVSGGQQARFYIWSFFPLPMNVFHWTLPTRVISLGPLGNVSAHLVSTFSWGPGVNQWIVVENRGGGYVNATLRFSLDRRFGSLLAEPLS